MNDMKRALHDAFAPPPPERKREFLRQHAATAMPMHRMLLTQAGYIPLWVRVMSLGILCLGILIALTMGELRMMLLSALTPLLSLILIAECGRSERHGMAELELSTRLSLKALVLARLAILGGGCLGILALLLPMALWQGTVAPVAAGLYLLTPFLLNTYAGLHMVRRFRGSEGMYGCVGVTACTVCLLLLSHSRYPAMYLQSSLQLWALAAALLCWGIGKQWAILISQKEELQWS